MTLDPQALTGFTFSLEVFKFYSGLMQMEDADQDKSQLPSQGSNLEQGLGGKLLWAGELDSLGRALVVAGNIAGAATLTVTADVDAQKQAVREGIVDFLVTSLDEALRILKNEIRKRQTVAVCVGAALEAVESEMVERGVQPDLFREGVIAAAGRGRAAHRTVGHPELHPMNMEALVTWRVVAAPAVWLPKLDAIALECIEADDEIARRWLRQAGRSMGRLGHGEHLLVSNREFAARMIERVSDQVQCGKLKARGLIRVSFMGGNDEFQFGSESSSDAN